MHGIWGEEGSPCNKRGPGTKWAPRNVADPQGLCTTCAGRRCTSKCASVGSRDPNDSRVSCLFVAAPLPLCDSVSLLEGVCELPALTSHVLAPPPPAYPSRTCSQPSPTNTVPLTHPHVAQTAGGWWGWRLGPPSRVGAALPLPWEPLSPAVAASLRGSLSLAVSLSRPLPPPAASEIYCILT